MNTFVNLLTLVQTLLTLQGTPVAELMSDASATGTLGVQVPRSANL